jgi:hypothetical protein
MTDCAPTVIDWLDYLRERRSRLTDKDELGKLDLFIEHLTADYVQDVPRTIATMHPEGTSRQWGGGPMLETLPSEVPTSARSAVYTQIVALGGYNALKLLATETDRLIVGEDGIFTDGILWNTVPGSELDLWGGGPLPEGAAADDVFEVGRRLAIVMSYRDGLIVGEDLYWNGPAIVRKVDSAPAMPAQP